MFKDQVSKLPRHSDNHYRDFKFWMNRYLLLRMANLESIDDTMFKRPSTFIYSMSICLEPTELIGELLSKACPNERYPGRLKFFDMNRIKIGKVCVTNPAKSYSENWKYDWIDLSITCFEELLKSQFDCDLQN